MKTLLEIATAVALVIAALLVAPGAARASEAALGDDGAVYRLAVGEYGTLFPDGAAAAPEAHVLALDLTAPGESRLRRLVPGSESAALDLSPTLLFESGSGTAYVIWERRGDGGESSILLAGIHGDQWIGPVELSGDAAPLKRAPTVLVTRDEFPRPTVTEGEVLQARTVLHVVWWQEAADGEPAVQYTPVVMENGAYVGWNPVFELDALDPNGPAEKLAGGPDLFRSPTLTVGTDVHTAVVAFANPRTGRLLTVQARVLPGELGLLADRIPGAVVAAGYTPGPDRMEAIRGVLRSHVIEIGGRFNPGLIDHFAAAVVATADVLHEARPNRPLKALGDDLRSHVIEIGARMLGDVRRPAFDKSSRVIEVRGEAGAEGPEILSSLVHLRLVKDLPVPESGDGATEIYVSEDGERLLVSWQRPGGLSYVESVAESAGEEGAGSPWTTPLALELGDGLEPGEAASILRSRVLQRP